MAVELNWGLAAPQGNVLGQVLGAYQTGQQMRDQRETRNALAQYGSDPDGAINALMRVDPRQATELMAAREHQQDRAAQQAQRHAGVLLNGAQALRRLPAEQREAGFDQIVPALRAAGMDDAAIGQLKGSDKSDAALDGFITALGGADGKYSFHNVDGTGFVFNEKTGEVGKPVNGRRYLKIGKDETAYPLDDNGDPILPHQGGAAHQPAASPAGFDAVYAGFTAPHEGGFTSSDGNGAPANFGINQKANPDVDVASLTPEKAKAIYRERYWGPSGADNLAPELQAVHFDTAVNMGLGAAQQLLQQSGGDPQRYLALREQRYRDIARRDPSKADRLPGWLQRNADLGGYIGGQGAPQGRPVLHGSGVGGESASGLPAGATGDEVLKALSPADANLVKGLSEGRVALPTGAALRSPYWQRIMAATTQYDPSFDEANAKSRFATRKDFTSGKAAGNVTSFNTAIGHLDTLDHSIDKLGNTGFPLNNTAAHLIARATGTDQRLADFETAKNAVADELTRAFRGSGGTLTDVEGWKHELDASRNPETLHRTVRQMVELLHSRLEALGQQYNQGMGTTKDPLSLLNPKAARAMARLAGMEEPATSEQIAAEVANAPAPRPAAPVKGPNGRVRRYNPQSGRFE